jgi:AcrR family transcriptional regulator
MATAARKKADRPATDNSDSPWASPDRRASERMRKREAVIGAAARAFKERGYHNTSLDDIAALLHVTKPTIYHYVENKEQILFECFRTGLDQIRAAFGAVRRPDAPARERLELVIRRYAAAVTSEFGWCMVRAEDQDLSPAMSGQVKTLKSEIDQGIRRLLREGREDGSIRADVDPKMTAFALAGALNWIAHWYRSDATLTPDEIADRFVVLFVDGLRPR